MRAEHKFGPYFYGVDAVRFVAAISVAMFHLGFMSWASGDNNTSRALGGGASFPELGPYVHCGWIGVPVFFVISGLVIANSASTSTALDFAKGRLLRLWPAAWVCATLTLVVWYLIGPLDNILQRYAVSMAVWFKGPWVDGVYWTLGVEVLFYGIVFCLLAAKQVHRLPVLAWVLSLSSLVFLTANLTAENVPTFSYDYLFNYWGLFGTGMFIWLIASRGPTPPLVCGFLVAMASGIEQIHLTGTRHADWSQDAVPLGIWLAGVACICISVKLASAIARAPSAVRRSLRIVGLMTYPIYLLHNVVGAYAVRLWIEAGTNPTVALVLGLSVVLALSYLVCTAVEPGIRTHLNALLSTVSAAWPADTPSPVRHTAP